VATFVSTTFAGVLYARDDVSFITMIFVAIARPGILLYGLPFSFTFIMILLAHELGHFFACRYYGIRCTPPYFLPLPISIAGTLGAFIRIKAPFQHRRALFDVGVAGPLAGFAFVVPALVVGIAHSQLIPKGSVAGGYSFGEPILFRMVGNLVLGYAPERQDMLAHPIAMAAWFGLLATSLNLFPIWQLDGGHMSYAILGREVQKRVSVLGTVALIAVSFLGWPIPSYLVFGLLLLLFGLRYKFFHPATLSDEEELGPGRIFIGMLALIILILSFTPVPISLT
jgi:membrane-associated protease RseP (regulator of RpoE activity)